MSALTLLAGIAFLAHPAPLAARGQAEPKLTLTLQAMPAADVVRQISELTHTQLATSPQTENDIVCLRFKDVPLSEALDRIASAVDGTWKTEGDIKRLIRTSEQARQERAREFAQDVERYRKAIQDLRDKQQKLASWSEDQAENLAARAENLMREYRPDAPNTGWFEKAMTITQQAPVGRILAEIAEQMDPRELADLPIYYKTVWAENPTAVQRKIPDSLLPLIRRFAQYQNQWSSAAQRHHLTDSSSNLGSFWLGGFGSDLNGNEKEIGMVLLTASRYTTLLGMDLSLFAYDKRGVRLGETHLSLGGDYMGLGIMDKDGSTPSGERPVGLSADAKRLLKTIGDGRHPQAPLTQDLIDSILNPRQIDPLALFVSPQLVQSADVKGLNMVACLPDMSMNAGTMGSGADVPADQFLKRLAFFQTTVEVGSGWIVAKPSRPSEEREIRADRSVLESYLRRLRTGDQLTIDESAYYALKFADPERNSLPSFMTNLLRAPVHGQNNRDMLRLYGLLTLQQRKQSAQDGLSLSSLTDAQLAYVNRMVYGWNAHLQFDFQRLSKQSGGTFTSNDWALVGDGVYSQPTEILPSGVPGRGILRMSSDVFSVVVPEAKDPSSRAIRTTLRPQDLAWQQFTQERPDLFPWIDQGSNKLDLSSLQYGQNVRLLFNFEFTPVVSHLERLEGRGGSGFTKASLDSLPDDFKKQYEEAYQNLKKSYANVKPGDIRAPTRTTVPPP